MEEEDPLIVKAKRKRLTSCDPSSTSKKMLALFLTAGVAVLVIGGSIGLAVSLREEGDSVQTSFKDSDLTAIHLSESGRYRHAAIATDNRDCASVGIKVLAEMQGSAVDAAIATALCTGLQTMDSSGIGGGHVMTIYERPRDGATKEFHSLTARETAPSSATADMYEDGESSETGGLAIAVPGEIAGYYTAWKKFGRVPWKDLFQPSIQMARQGIYVDKHLADKIASNLDNVLADPGLREMLIKEDGTQANEGDYVVNVRLARTLEKIAHEGPSAFYNGSLTDDIVGEIKGFDGIITKEDLALYTPKWSEPFVSTIPSKNWNMHSNGAPSSGPTLQFMVRLLDGFGFTKDDLKGDRASTTYQRIIETMKFGYGRRTWLSDPAFTDLTELMRNLTSDDYLDSVRSQITDSRTHSVEYYGPAGRVVSDGGTSHIAVLAADGAAVSMTTTINRAFGAKVMGAKTGIIYNNEMDDFSLPGEKNAWGLRPSPGNLIEGGKRPVSSMCPTIITNSHGEVQMVIGGSGGSKITSSTLYVLAHFLWLGKPINTAVDQVRLHHQLQPNRIQHEEAFDKSILHALEEKGHWVEPTDPIAVVQAIHNVCGNCVTRGCHRNCIIAVSDKRKGGIPDGY